MALLFQRRNMRVRHFDDFQMAWTHRKKTLCNLDTKNADISLSNLPFKSNMVILLGLLSLSEFFQKLHHYTGSTNTWIGGVVEGCVVVRDGWSSVPFEILSSQPP